MKDNKWNEEDCGPKMAILEDGLVIKHSQSNRFKITFLKFN